METFNYYQKKKIIVWEETQFTIEANSQEEADNQINNQSSYDIDNMTGILIGGSEILHDTSKRISMEDNGGFSTIEIYSVEQGALIAANGLDIEDK